MAKRAARLFFILTLSFVALNLSAQERKGIAKPAPKYPEVARKLGLVGNVKVEVVIAPDGHITDTKVIGGHPALVNAFRKLSRIGDTRRRILKRPRC
jgi:Gram-negative bacterial TonB protein C-terminal